MKWTAVLLVIGLAGLSESVPSPMDYSYLNYEMSREIDSEEYGQFAGNKSPNCTCGWTNKNEGRIVGGKETKLNQYPYMVGIGYLDPLDKSRLMGTFCGATILTTRHVITAAHCTYDDHGSAMGIITGAHDVSLKTDTKYTKVYVIEKMIEHPGWSASTYENDIAIILIKSPIEFNRGVGPVCLPNKYTYPKEGLVGQHLKVTGWGDTKKNGDSSDVLLKVNLKVLDNKFCVQGYPKKPISSKQICTYSYQKDSCQGDSGGPLTWLDPETNRYTLAGVVSYGLGCATMIPGVNTNVLSYMDWIQKTIGDTSPSRVSTCSKPF